MYMLSWLPTWDSASGLSLPTGAGLISLLLLFQNTSRPCLAQFYGNWDLMVTRLDLSNHKTGPSEGCLHVCHHTKPRIQGRGSSPTKIFYSFLHPRMDTTHHSPILKSLDFSRILVWLSANFFAHKHSSLDILIILTLIKSCLSLRTMLVSQPFKSMWLFSLPQSLKQ